MGGGPRTFPGGLNKWQWKRMHEKKAREKEKRLLEQEKQLYEARMRSQIRAKLSQPDPSPQQQQQHSPMSPQSHIKALADRFMKQGAEDLWNEDDGPVDANQRSSLSPTTRTTSARVDLRGLVAGNRDSRNVSLDSGFDSSRFVGIRKYSVQSGSRNGRNVKSFVKNSNSGLGKGSDSRNVREFIKNRVGGGGGRRRFKRNESSSSDDDELDFELENVGDKVEGWSDVKRLGSSASLGKYDVKITRRRVPLNKVDEETDFAEELESIKKEISKSKLVEDKGSFEKESVLSQKRQVL